MKKLANFLFSLYSWSSSSFITIIINILTREEHVHELAVGRPCAQLLDFGKLRLQNIFLAKIYLIKFCLHNFFGQLCLYNLFLQVRKLIKFCLINLGHFVNFENMSWKLIKIYCDVGWLLNN